MGLKVNPVPEVKQVYKDLEGKLVLLAHVGKSGLWDLKVYLDHKAFQESKVSEVKQDAKGNAAVLVHAVHVAHAVHVVHVVRVFVLL